MTVMALAERYPDLVRQRVVAAVALVGTSSGRLGEVNFGLPVAGVDAVRGVLPVLKALGQQAALVERGRRATADLFAGIIKRYSFASGTSTRPSCGSPNG